MNDDRITDGEIIGWAVLLVSVAAIVGYLARNANALSSVLWMLSIGGGR